MASKSPDVDPRPSVDRPLAANVGRLVSTLKDDRYETAVARIPSENGEYDLVSCDMPATKIVAGRLD